MANEYYRDPNGPGRTRVTGVTNYTADNRISLSQTLMSETRYTSIADGIKAASGNDSGFQRKLDDLAKAVNLKSGNVDPNQLNKVLDSHPDKGFVRAYRALAEGTGSSIAAISAVKEDLNLPAEMRLGNKFCVGATPELSKAHQAALEMQKLSKMDPSQRGAYIAQVAASGHKLEKEALANTMEHFPNLASDLARTAGSLEKAALPGFIERTTEFASKFLGGKAKAALAVVGFAVSALPGVASAHTSEQRADEFRKASIELVTPPAVSIIRELAIASSDPADVARRRNESLGQLKERDKNILNALDPARNPASPLASILVGGKPVAIADLNDPVKAMQIKAALGQAAVNATNSGDKAGAQSFADAQKLVDMHATTLAPRIASLEKDVRTADAGDAAPQRTRVVAAMAI